MVGKENIKLEELLDSNLNGGKNIMLIGPPMCGKKVILNNLMYHGAAKNENAVISVNTREPGASILEWFTENRLFLPRSRIGIVDCITEMMGGTAYEDESIKTARSPLDLTGIGIKTGQFFDKFFSIRNIRKVHLYIDSLSTLLMYSNIKNVFRFLHVFSRRIKAVSGVGVYVMESGIHDIGTMVSLKQLIDGMIEVKSENDSNFLRVVGLSSRPTDWIEYEIHGAKIRTLG